MDKYRLKMDEIMSFKLDTVQTRLKELRGKDSLSSLESELVTVLFDLECMLLENKRMEANTQKLDMKITLQNSDIPPKIQSALAKIGVETLGDLTKFTEGELLRSVMIRRGSISIIKAVLTKRGLTLRTYPTPPGPGSVD